MTEETRLDDATTQSQTGDNDADTLILFTWNDGNTQRSGLGVDPLAVDGTLKIESNLPDFMKLQYAGENEAVWHTMTKVGITYTFTGPMEERYYFRILVGNQPTQILARVQVGQGNGTRIPLKKMKAALIQTINGPAMPFVVKRPSQNGVFVLPYYYEESVAEIGINMLKPVWAGGQDINLPNEQVKAVHATQSAQTSCLVNYVGAFGTKAEAGGGEFIIIDIC